MKTQKHEGFEVVMNEQGEITHVIDAPFYVYQDYVVGEHDDHRLSFQDYAKVCAQDIFYPEPDCVYNIPGFGAMQL